MMKILQFLGILFFAYQIGFAQLSYPNELKIDTSFAYFQFYQRDLGERLAKHFENSKNDKVVVFHYGASHIQAERPTTFTRKTLQDKFGTGGRGMIFNFKAADSYSSINYKTEATGEWNFAKAYQMPPKLPLGVTGMTVETKTLGAQLKFIFKDSIPNNAHRITVFFERDSLCSDFTLKINEQSVSCNGDNSSFSKNHFEVNYVGEINEITLTVNYNKDSLASFRFYGIDIENELNSGVVYHSLGVGASPMRSVLYQDKMPEQAEYLKPDIVLLDYGTNDILYNNAVDAKLADQVRKAIANFRKVNPDVIMVLTSTQDLYRKGKYITAGPVFRDLMDSLAKEQNCMFWNWYDLSGGLKTIRTWNELGYAQGDFIHLTQKGYEIKGEMLAKSIINTIERVQKDKELSALVTPTKNYAASHIQDTNSNTNAETVMTGGAIDVALEIKKPVASSVKPSYYKVKSGDTLSEIAAKYHTTITKIKSLNKLNSNLIRVGQSLRVK